MADPNQSGIFDPVPPDQPSSAWGLVWVGGMLALVATIVLLMAHAN